MTRQAQIREIIRNIGVKSILASVLVFLLTVAATGVGGSLLYRSTKTSILRQGELNALQSAKEFDRYLLVRKQAVMLAGDVVDSMIRENRTSAEILEYLTRETQSIKTSFGREYTGLYGWILGEYCDGEGWIPDEDYIPTSRPWYLETIGDNRDITFDKPYLDEQTKTVMMTMSKLLCDGSSVLALDISLTRIQEITEEIAGKTPGSYGMVLDRTGQVIAHSVNAELGKNYLEEAGTLWAALAERLFQGERQFELRYGGETYMVYSENIEGDWKCVSLLNAGIVFRPLSLIVLALLVLALLEAVVFLTAFYNLSSNNLAISLQNVQLGAIADMYVTIRDINLAADSIRIIHKNGREAHAPGETEHGVQAVLNDLVRENVNELSLAVMNPFVDVSTLAGRLGKIDTLTEEYLDVHRKWCRARYVVAERDRDGKAVRLLWMVESIDEEKRRRDNLKTLSETDQMTGLNNRTAGERKIRALVNGGVGGMFIMFDIDKFKSVNDRFGHDVGDKVIVGLAACMTEAFRTTDILMRLGGDEFIAYAPGVLTKKNGRRIIDRLFRNVRDYEVTELGDSHISISVGATFCQDDEIVPYEELYKRADICAYESKKREGNAVTFYQEQSGT